MQASLWQCEERVGLHNHPLEGVGLENPICNALKIIISLSCTEGKKFVTEVRE